MVIMTLSGNKILIISMETESIHRKFVFLSWWVSWFFPTRLNLTKWGSSKHYCLSKLYLCLGGGNQHDKFLNDRPCLSSTEMHTFLWNYLISHFKNTFGFAYNKFRTRKSLLKNWNHPFLMEYINYVNGVAIS